MYIYNVGFRNNHAINNTIYVYESVQELFKKELGNQAFTKDGNIYYSETYVAEEYEIKKGEILEIIE